ncbi:MAG: RNA-binding protein [Candidatus Nanohalarchaeota archaeon]|nr:MAG: RNA-binding protein [Candidatus Nanohaloarchaeota archaeon]
MKCISCGKNIGSTTHYSTFLCPACGETQITRCNQCKKRAVRYKCSKCGFIGP